MHSLELNTYGFETAKALLGVGSNALIKLVALKLISVFDDDSSAKNQRYAGWDLGFLVSARDRPLFVPGDELALVCSMGVETQEALP